MSADEPAILLLELVDPAALGLPSEEAGNVLVLMSAVELGPVTVVVDQGTAMLLAHAAGMEDFATTPWNLAAAHWLRPGHPDSWARPDEPTHWIRPSDNRRQEA